MTRRSNMHAYAKCLLIAGSLLISGGLVAQEFYRPPDPNLLAKLSYDRSPRSPFDKEAGIQHICLAVSRGQDYRIVRLFDDGTTQRLHGKLTKQQFEQLKRLLGSSDFRVLSGSHGGLIRRDSKSFGAEIPKAG